MPNYALIDGSGIIVNLVVASPADIEGIAGDNSYEEMIESSTYHIGKMVGEASVAIADTATPRETFIQQDSPGPLSSPYVWWEIDELGNDISTHVWTP